MTRYTIKEGDVRQRLLSRGISEHMIVHVEGRLRMQVSKNSSEKIDSTKHKEAQQSSQIIDIISNKLPFFSLSSMVACFMSTQHRTS